MVAKFVRDNEHIWKKVGEALFFLVVLGVVFTIIFFGGGAINAFLEGLANSYILPIFSTLGNMLPAPYGVMLSNGLYSGMVLGLSLVVSYLIIFHFLMSLLEESNFIARVSHDADFIFRRIGLSGRAALPLLMGYGCTVPAVLGAKIAKDSKEKIAIGFLSLFLPCAARTSVILALVGAFLGPMMAVTVYIIDAVIVLMVGVGVNRFLGLRSSQQMFAKPNYKLPNVHLAVSKTYYETLEFIQLSLPWLIAGTMVVEVLNMTGLLELIGLTVKPMLFVLFGLPEVTFIPLVFGVVRGELAIAMLVAVGGTADFSLLLTPKQMLVFTVISMIYMPCLSTLAALIKEFGKRDSAVIVVVNSLLTLIIGISMNVILSQFID